MLLKTYNKRFTLPVEYLQILFNPVVRAKNGQFYSVTLNKKGQPVARNINDQFKSVTSGELFERDGTVHHKLSPSLQEALTGEKGAPFDDPNTKGSKKDIKFT